MVHDFHKKGTLRRSWGLLPRETKKQILAGGLALVLLALVAGGMAWGGYAWLSRSEFFQITAIRIEGNERLAKETILTLSGVDVHANLLALDTEAVRRNILAHPWIDRVRVRRDWPNHLGIVIHERRPVVLVNTGGGLYYVDRKAKVYAEAGGEADLDFPVITGLEGAGPDRLRAEGDPRIEQAVAFMRYAARGSSALPRQNISEFHFGPEGEIELFLADRPFPVYMGRDLSRSTYYRLAKVLYWLYKKREFAHVTYIRMDYLEDKVLVGKDEG